MTLNFLCFRVHFGEVLEIYCGLKMRCTHAFGVKVWIVEFMFELNCVFGEVFELLELKSVKIWNVFGKKKNQYRVCFVYLEILYNFFKKILSFGLIYAKIWNFWVTNCVNSKIKVYFSEKDKNWIIICDSNHGSKHANFWKCTFGREKKTLFSLISGK